MEIGKVVGSLWATRKDEKLHGQKLLIVRLMYSGRDNAHIVAADHVGAGVHDTVLITKGSSARVSVSEKQIPIDAVIVGIVDTIDMTTEEL